MTERKRLTPKKVLSEATALTNAIVDGIHDDDEPQGEEELYEATSDPSGSTLHTNQLPLVEGEFFVDEQSAYDRVLLANHALRMSFVEHLVLQHETSLHEQMQDMQKQMIREMDIIEGARVGNFLNGRKQTTPHGRKQRG